MRYHSPMIRWETQPRGRDEEELTLESFEGKLRGNVGFKIEAVDEDDSRFYGYDKAVSLEVTYGDFIEGADLEMARTSARNSLTFRFVRGDQGDYIFDRVDNTSWSNKRIYLDPTHTQVKILKKWDI